MSKLLFGTNNAAKQREISKALESLPGIELVFSNQFDSTKELDPEETGSTTFENALIKARAFAKTSGLIAAAEDSGLEVVTLDNKPGIYSKRFHPGTDTDRNNEILRLLKDKQDRSARFVCAIALYNPKTDETHYFEGTVEGRIADEIEGDGGFGYDPIFIPNGFDQSFAVLGDEVKGKISHRARALQKFSQFLSSI